MKPDEFEQQLRNQPLRPVPFEWRAEILREANASVAADVRRLNLPGHKSESLLTSAPTTWWREWLWPSPQTWAGLAAVWLVLLALHVTAPSFSRTMTAQPETPSPEARMALAAQRREMARLLDGPVEPTPASIPAVPGPRSERTTSSKA